MTVPPAAKKVPRKVELHGETLHDDYDWLREKSNPEVIAHLESENAYTDDLMRPTAQFQEDLYQEMLGRIKETDLSVPYRKGGWFYYGRTEKGLQYPMFCRKPGSLEAEEQVVLDVNRLAEGKKFMSIGAYTVSDDARLLAYSTDETGFRQYTLFVKDIESGELFSTRVEKTGSVVWAADNRTLFYTVEDAAKRQYRVYRHELGTDVHQLIYEETDERFRVSVGKSRSRQWLFIAASSHTASEVRCLRADHPRGEFQLIAAREAEHEYDVAHHGEVFYIRSNQTGRNFALFTAPVADPRRENWRSVLSHREAVMLSGVDVFARHIVLLEREDGLPHLRVTNLATGDWHRVAFPEPAYSAGPEANPEFDSSVYRYAYQSMVTPASVYDYDMETRQSTLLKQTDVLGGYDASRYRSERIHAVASDGTRIPMSLVYKNGIPKPAPMLLYGYGSYGHVIPAGFNSNRLTLLDRGFVYAIAHIRGGGEMGKTWHDQGRMKCKMNTFADFIACAGHLVAEDVTSPEKLAVMGGSAGGLLMGAVANMRPDLFHAIVSVVPFVDVINTMLDESLPLTVGEFEEWGNPKRKEDFLVMREYCPYTNLGRKKYPEMLIRTSLNDSQVMYWEPAKYAARLRELNPDARVMLKINMAAGHGGASGRYDYLREVAFDYAYLLTVMAPTRPL